MGLLYLYVYLCHYHPKAHTNILLTPKILLTVLFYLEKPTVTLPVLTVFVAYIIIKSNKESHSCRDFIKNNHASVIT
jgi:hypothetical protein